MFRELNQLFKQFLYHILFWFQLTFRFQQPFCQSVVELSTDPDESDFEKEKLDHEQEIIFQGTHDNNSFFVEVNVFESAVSVILMFLVDGQKYVWPNGHLEFSRNRLSERLLNFGPLRIELREPYRLWRITFRGDLRTSDGSLRFFSWESWWSPVSDPHFYTRDVPIHLAAKFAAATNNSRLLQKTEDNLQWGVLRGRLLVEGAEAKEMNLRGFRLRQTGESQTVRLENLTTAFLSTGERTSRFEFSVPNCPGLLEFGIKFGADRRKKVFVQHDDEEVENLIVHSFKFDGDSSINLEISRLLNRQGSGFTRFVENLNWNSIHSEIEQRTDYVYKADQFERKLRILPFTHRACMDSELTGGKGSNLAKLTTVEHKFVVPRGFVVTTTSFREHLNSHMELNEFYSSLKKSHGHDFEEIEKRAKELFAKFRLNDELKESIYDQLNRMYNGQQSSHRFSVRSSAFGEDGAELSSAGQLETFLYVEIDDISEKLLMCWASNFRREVLNYRFENNQQLATPMAVVIQEMIDDGKAGVVFTSDPVRSDPSRVVINLVDGDGEKLVSGQTIPMQLTVLKRDLSVVEKIGDEVLGVDSCMQIVNVGLYLESVFDHPQDIEFVWKVDEIFVVQSRHITTLDIESEWELQHEFDVATLSKHAILSTANVGEVMPVALTPLDCSIIGTAFDRAIRSIFSYMLPVKENIHRHSNSVFVIYRQRVFFDLLETLLRNWEDISKNRAPEYNLAGSKIFTDEMLELGPQHFPRKTTSQRLYEVYALTKMIFFDSKRIFANIQHLSEEMKMCTVPDDSKDILSAIQVQLDYYVQLIEQHSKATLFSNLTYVIVAMILNGTSNNNLTTKTLNSIATIYSNNPHKLISADIPVALKKLAISIKSHTPVQVELNQLNDPQKVVEFLQKDKSECGQLTREFFHKHGHRGLHELLLTGRPYIQNPEQMVSTIKHLINDPNLENEQPKEITKDVDQLLDSLDVELNASQRYFLKLFIPHAHRSIELRESAKNLLVYGIFLIRNSFLKLGNRLNLERILNHPDIVFHLTHMELKNLVKNNTTGLLSRARRRQRLYEQQLKKRYAPLSIGVPTILIDDTSDTKRKVNLRLSGTTVCEGQVSGRARVVRTLFEAKDTEPGEVLITTWTDIAWSPLFPTISGLVTEIGGLLSHGAVVAREYRLPCLIAVHNATSEFKTGDMVLLNTFKGTIERLNDEATDKQNDEC